MSSPDLNPAPEQDAAADPRRSGPRRFGAMLAVILASIVIVIVAIVGGILGFILLAPVVPVTPVLFGAAIVLGALIAAGLSWLVFARTRRRRSPGSWARRARLTQVCAGAAALVLIAVTVVANLPLPGTPGRGPAPEGTSYVTLSTGSKIAWWKTPATTPSDKAPVVFVHGGPGGSIDGTVPMLDQLADSGRDVYYFDQPGAGHSGMLDAGEYSIGRLVEDLDAFRVDVVKSDKIDLIGHSFGGFYATAYAAAHPDAIEKLVLATPLSYENSHEDNSDEAEQPETEESSGSGFDLSSFVHTALYSKLRDISPEAAENYLPQEDQLRVDVFGTGLNLEANLAIDEDGNAQAENVIDGYAQSAPSTLILRSENDYIYWPALRVYRDINPNATLVFVPGRDHNILWDGAADTSPFEGIRTFLDGEPQAGIVYDGKAYPTPENVGAE